MNIVLVEPQIPPNTGNIARLCAATNTKLHLIGPMGFSLDDKYLKRAGLDYWPLVDMEYYKTYNDFVIKEKKGTLYYLSTKGVKLYTEVNYNEEDYLIFGNETSGLSEELLISNPENSITIPMLGKIRSLNLSCSAAVVLYEALRQVKKF